MRGIRGNGGIWNEVRGNRGIWNEVVRGNGGVRNEGVSKAVLKGLTGGASELKATKRRRVKVWVFRME
jgi:hypothetical protein